MALPSLRDAMTRATGGVSAAALAATLIFSPAAVNDAQAQSVKPVAVTGSTEETGGKILDAVRKARDFSQNAGSVGFVVYNGKGNETPAKSVGDQFAAEFSRRGINSAYYVVDVEKTGMTISYHVGSVGKGPMTVTEAAASLGDIVRLRQAANRLLAAEPLKKLG
jgi:hypothetical protein